MRFVLPLAAWLSCAAAGNAQAMNTVSSFERTTPQAWAIAAANNEQRIIADDGSFPLRYRMRKVDAKSDITRDIIETRQGTVARLVQRDGQPLTAEQDKDERSRLTGLLDSPSDFIKHHKRDNAARNYSIQLVQQMPEAMTYTFAPGQPQRPNFAGPQVVLDFLPNPQYKPPSLVCQVLTGLQGRIWIDRASKQILRVEGSVIRPVDIGWGMLARVYPGGTVELEQANAGGDRWTFAHLRENVTIREMMVKTVQQHTVMDAADFQLLPAPVDYQHAIRMLLDTPLQLR